MLQTPLCESLGVDLPIWNAGMGGGGAGAELAAAVSNAGGFGVLGMGGLPAAADPGRDPAHPSTHHPPVRGEPAVAVRRRRPGRDVPGGARRGPGVVLG